MRKLFGVALAATMVLAVSSCGDDDDSADEPQGGGAESAALAVVTVEPLEDMVNDVAEAFGDEQPDVELDITTVEDRSGVGDALEAADVVIAPRSWMAGITDTELVDWGRNLAVIAVAEGNPQDLGAPAFAADSEASTLVCGEESTIGNFSVAVLEAVGVSPDPSTVEAGCDQDALDRIATGDLDAALVYRSGLDVPDGVELMPIPDEQNVIIRVVATPVGGTEDAEAFTDFGQSETAQTILESLGYLP